MVSRFGRLPSGPSPLPMPPPNSMTVSTPASIAVFMHDTHLTGLNSWKNSRERIALLADSCSLPV